MKSQKIIIIVLFIALIGFNFNSLHAQSDHDQHESSTNNSEIVKMLKTMQEDIKQLQKSLKKDGMKDMDMKDTKSMDMKGMKSMGMMKMMKGMDMMKMMKMMKGMDMKGMKDMDMKDTKSMDMKGMKSMDMKDMKSMDMKDMKSMDMKGMKSMGMMKMMMGKMKGMKMMGKMDEMPKSALPGFPGASHIYHIGSSNFFLDHEDHIALTLEQKTQLNKAKVKSGLSQKKSEREIEQAEQELWELTSSDMPNIDKIESKVRQIDKLNGDQRLAFIRAVGESVKVLSKEQVKNLTGAAKDHTQKKPTDDHSTHIQDK